MPKTRPQFSPRSTMLSSMVKRDLDYGFSGAVLSPWDSRRLFGFLQVCPVHLGSCSARS